jgi:hypothetical protein
MTTYKLIIDSQTKNQSIVKIDDNGIAWGLPKDPDNTDYQAFLLWKSEGNEPLPADEVTK